MHVPSKLSVGGLLWSGSTHVGGIVWCEVWGHSNEYFTVDTLLVIISVLTMMTQICDRTVCHSPHFLWVSMHMFDTCMADRHVWQMALHIHIVFIVNYLHKLTNSNKHRHTHTHKHTFIHTDQKHGYSERTASGKHRLEPYYYHHIGSCNYISY